MKVFGRRRTANVAWSGFLDCGDCRRWRIHYGTRVRRWLAVCSIPVVPLGGDREVMCAVCNHRQLLSRRAFGALRLRAARNLRLAEQYQHDPPELRRRLALASAQDAPAAARRLEPA